MLKVTARINFDFQKGLNSLENIINMQKDMSAKDAAEDMKKRIVSGLAPLKPSTMAIRKARGQDAFGNSPLQATASLIASIRPVKGGVEMLKYGLYHHRGFTPTKIPYILGKGGRTISEGRVFRGDPIIAYAKNTSGVSVPARPFIFPSDKSMKAASRRFIKSLRKAIRTPLKTPK